MLTEEQWLKITQAFPSKPENAIQNLGSGKDDSEVPHQQCLNLPIKSSRNSAPPIPEVKITPQNEPIRSTSDAEIRMNAFLRQKLGMKFKEPKPHQKSFKSRSSNEEADVLTGFEKMEFKLNSLASQLLVKNRRIEEQDMKITELERKLAVREITGSLSENFQEEGKAGGESSFDELHLIEQRLIRLEAQMETLLCQKTKGDGQKLKNPSSNPSIKPRENIASISRLNANTSITPSADEKIDKAFFEEKINNLEKIVEKLKQFMFTLILSKRQYMYVASKS